MSKRPAGKLNQSRVSTNVTTDTGACFEAGNVLVALLHSITAALPSMIVFGAALGARAVHEIKQDEVGAEKLTALGETLENSPITNNFITNNPATRKLSGVFKAMTDNPGVGIEVSAVGLGLSAISIPTMAALSGDTETLSSFYHWGEEAAILGTFCVANALNGSAPRVGSTATQNFMKAGGLALATTGVMMAGGDNVIPIEEIANFDIPAAITTTIEDIKNRGCTR